MKKFCLVLIVIIMLSVLIIGCGGGGSITPTDPEEQVNALLDKYATAMKSNNVDSVLACLTDPFNSFGTDYDHTSYQLVLSFGFGLTPFSEYQLIERTVTIVDSTNATVTLKESYTQNFLGTPTSNTTVLEKFTLVKPSGWKITKIETGP